MIKVSLVKISKAYQPINIIKRDMAPLKRQKTQFPQLAQDPIYMHGT